MDYVKGLNERQKEAVLHTEGPLLILAGAGSGKTRVLTHRVAYLIEENDVFPGNILALTFTNKAANEMKERIGNLLNENVDSMWVGTFHSICVRILRRDIDKIGYERSFSIYDRDDQITLMKECIKEKNIDNKMYNERAMLSAISHLKDSMTPPDLYIKENYSDFYSRNVGELYKLYEEKLKKNNALDFDDLILKTVELLQSNPDILKYYQKKFRYIFVDEFQDTNKPQYQLIRLFARRYKNICVVGDDDQCVVEGSKITTPEGEVLIENLVENHKIYSASGKGETSEGTVEKIVKKEYEGSIIKIKTKTGKTIKVTPNHIMFGKLNPESGTYYVYLMYRKDKGYRIGITQGVSSREGEIVNGLLVRLNQEHGDKAWILRVCQNKGEAMFYEQLLSMKYQIPTSVFQVAHKNMTLEQKYIDRLFSEVDTEHNVGGLMNDLLLFEEYPHYYRPNGVIRGQTTRRIVNISMFSGRKTGLDSGWYSHRISFNTSGEDLKNRIESLGFPVRDGQRDTWRVETERKDYDAAVKYGNKLEGIDKGIEIVQKANLTENTYFTYMPAAHIRPNMSIPVYENGKIIEDIVEETIVEEYKGFVYDISVPNFRQYICEDIVVHNSIYGWRGADITNILDFEKDFKDTNVIKLEQNYRSTQNILEVANHVIKNNNERKDKRLWTDNKKGSPVVIENLPDSHQEAYFVADKMEELMEKGYNPSEFSILYRTNAQSRSFEEVFMRKNIPYKLVGGLRFYDRREIKDIVAYLNVIQNPVDNISLRRIINVPRRGIGNATMEKIEEYADRTGESIYSALLSVEEIPRLSKRAINNLNSFIDMINRLISLKELIGVKDFIEEVIEETGYVKKLEEEDNIESQTRLENIKEFVSVAVDFEEQNEDGTLEDFLASVSLLSDVDKTEDIENSVTMLTVHSAKGLEFPVVFMVGMEEGLFPISRAMEDEDELEEERRLCYVAMTRAEELLYITNAKLRTIYGRTTYGIPSRFLKEIPDNLICSDRKGGGESPQKESTSFDDSPLRIRRFANSFKKEKTISKSKGNIKVGDKIRHKKWGEGTVVQIRDSSGDKEITIAFDREGLKKLLLSVAPIEVI